MLGAITQLGPVPAGVVTQSAFASVRAPRQSNPANSPVFTASALGRPSIRETGVTLPALRAT